MRSWAFLFFEARFINHMFPGGDGNAGRETGKIPAGSGLGSERYRGRILTEMEKLGDETMGVSLGVLM